MTNTCTSINFSGKKIKFLLVNPSTVYRWPNVPARPGTSLARPAKPGYEACRAQMGRHAAVAAQARPVSLLVVPGRPGGTMAHLSIL
jgi:hypothetical protein